MIAFLWTCVGAGVIELFCTLWWVSRGKVPVRSRSDMIVNAGIMFAVSMWAFWLLSRAA